MRVMGLLGLVLALVIVGLLVKKQMAATRAPLPSLAPPHRRPPRCARKASRCSSR